MPSFLILFGFLNLVTVVVWALQNSDNYNNIDIGQRLMMRNFLFSGIIFLFFGSILLVF